MEGTGSRPGRFPAQENTTCPSLCAGLRCGESAVRGRHRTAVVRACPVEVRFRACAPCTQPFFVAPTPSETPSAVTSVARSAGLRGALRTVTQSPWPSLLVVAQVAARRFRVRRATAERAVRVGGVVTLTSLALISEAGRLPESGASGASVRQAFADVAVAVGRVGTSEAHSSLPSVDKESPPTAPSVATTGAAPPRRQRRRGPRREGRVLLGFPVRGPVSSPFGTRVHPVTGRLRPHQGVDLAVPVGTPVVATARGRVLSAGRRGGYGLAVEVGHGSSRAHATSTLYAHLNSLPAGLRVGLRVRRGTVIGYSGGVGAGAGISTGPHVHYEVRSGGVAVDPGSVALAVWLRGSARNRAPVRRVEKGRRSQTDVRSRRRRPQRGIP